MSKSILKNKKVKIFPIFIVIFVSLVLVAAVYYLKYKQGVLGAQASGVQLQLLNTTASTSIKKGTEFTVNVYIDTAGMSVSGADIRVRYDQNQLLAETMTPGTFLPVVFVPGKITQGSGVAQIILGSSPSAPKSGAGILAAVKFKVLGQGTKTNIYFGTGSIVTAIGQTANVMEFPASSLDVTVLSAATPTPSSTLVPSHTASPSPTSVPTPVTQNIDPKGYLDSSSCTTSVGWTCDANNYTFPLNVHFYYDGPAGTGKFLGATVANVTREAAVGNLCGGNLNHGYVFTMPSVVKDNVSHTIYAYAINTPSGNNPLLLGSPKTIKCSP